MEDQKSAIKSSLAGEDNSIQPAQKNLHGEEIPLPPSARSSRVQPAATIQGHTEPHGNIATDLDGWAVLLVEDNATTRQEIRDYFADMRIDGKPFVFYEIGELREAYSLIRERKADLVILDIYRGEARLGGEKVGERVLDRITQTGFVPVILYTNLPEGLADNVNEFVRLVPKLDGLPALHEAVNSLFATKVPQMHRAIVNQLDRSLRNYMWGFVTENWSVLKTVADKPEFLRLLLQRLALSFVREGVTDTITEVFGAVDQINQAGVNTVHSAELYIKPPIGPDPLLGDIRIRQRGTEREHLVVLWPSCDMVSMGGRTPKTNIVLCGKAALLETMPESKKYIESQSKTAKKQLAELMKNNRDGNFGNPDRFHFLPGFLDIPNLVIDFQEIERLPLSEVIGFQCVGSLTSPYAENLGSRFTRYLGRIGTPDADIETVIASLAAVSSHGVNQPAASTSPEPGHVVSVQPAQSK